MVTDARQSNSSPQFSIKRRAAYSLAAGAAACAAASNADAAISYSGLQNLVVPQFDDKTVNLNLDGFDDIQLKNYVFGGGNYQGGYTFSGQFAAFKVGSLSYVSALGAGAPINAGTISPYFVSSMAYGVNNPNAQFNNAANGLIGFSFLSFPNTYYAWMRVGINNTAGTFVIKDWAYETTAGQGILAGDTGHGFVPEPGTLGLLAVGAAGVLAMRRNKRSNDKA